MLIIPAIDLLDGNVVRLEQGDYAKVKIYSGEPANIAGQWKDKGANLIHVVDLNGARDGIQKNLSQVEYMIKSTGIKVELGGGIRDLESIEKVFDVGVVKAVLGTAAINKRYFAEQCLSKYGGERILFSLDARKGEVFMEGWGLRSGYAIEDLTREFEAVGLKRIIYTDIARDGMLMGPNLDGVKELLSTTSLEVIVSGGISNLEDIKRLREFENQGLVGAIIGKALYEGKIDLGEAIEVADGRGTMDERR